MGGEHLGLEEEEVGGVVEGHVLYLLVDFRSAVLVGHHFCFTEKGIHFVVLIEGAVTRQAPVGRVKPVGKEELGIAVVRAPGAQGHLEIALVRSLTEGGPGHFFQIYLDTQLLEIILDNKGFRLVEGGVAGVEEVDFRHVLSGFCQEFLCLVQIVGVALDGFILAPHAFRHGAGELLAPALHGAVNDGVVVNGIGEGLTEDFVAGGKFPVVQVHNGAEEGRIFVDVDGLVVLQLVDLVQGDAFGNINIPLLQLQALGGRILDAVEENVLNGRRFAGVILLGIQLLV